MELEQIKVAIEGYFSDRSRTLESTKEGLEELQADIKGMLDALRAARRRERLAFTSWGVR